MSVEAEISKPRVSRPTTIYDRLAEARARREAAMSDKQEAPEDTPQKIVEKQDIPPVAPPVDAKPVRPNPSKELAHLQNDGEPLGTIILTPEQQVVAAVSMQTDSHTALPEGAKSHSRGGLHIAAILSVLALGSVLVYLANGNNSNSGVQLFPLPTQFLNPQSPDATEISVPQTGARMIEIPQPNPLEFVGAIDAQQVSLQTPPASISAQDKIAVFSDLADPTPAVDLQNMIDKDIAATRPDFPAIMAQETKPSVATEAPQALPIVTYESAPDLKIEWDESRVWQTSIPGSALTSTAQNPTLIDPAIAQPVNAETGRILQITRPPARGKTVSFRNTVQEATRERGSRFFNSFQNELTRLGLN
jgi:hypothetical protein